jgi:alpha-tubulin suppressor-like RCC1 family protein
MKIYYYIVNNKLALSGGKALTICVPIVNITGTLYNSLILTKQNQIWGWGVNSNGELGINSVVSKLTPVSILGNFKVFCYIDAGEYHVLALDINGLVWSWGYNGNGQLGDNSVVSKLTPVSVLGTLKTFCKITGGSACSLGIDKNGLIWSWGDNTNGQLGINSTVSKSTPVSILGTKKTFCQIVNFGQQTIIVESHSTGIDKNGLVWSWGLNSFGVLGNNSVTSRRTPVSILGALKTFCKISGGYYHSLAIDKNGLIWSWGSNQYGQLGINSVVSYSTPISVLGTLKTFCQIAAGYYYSLGLDKNGLVWAWGLNNYGTLGDNTGSGSNKSTPVSILGNLKTFCQINSGGVYSLALDYKGNIWSWGDNRNGALGLGFVNNYVNCVPDPVHGYFDKTFCQINGGTYLHSLGLDKNGLVWGWGYNKYGQLGINSTISYSTPYSILGNIKTFCKIDAGSNHSVGIDKNGLIWSWGMNNAGQLGINSTVSKSTPVSILGT